jgi:hypothetical protein
MSGRAQGRGLQEIGHLPEGGQLGTGVGGRALPACLGPRLLEKPPLEPLEIRRDHLRGQNLADRGHEARQLPGELRARPGGPREGQEFLADEM